MSDETPTERLAEATEELADERKKSSALMIALIVLGALLLIGLIVVLVVLLTRPSEGTAAPTPTTTESTSASPTPTATESESPTPTPTPPAPTPTQAPPAPPPSVIVSYTVSDSNVDCTAAGESIPVTFNWNTTGSEVSFGVQTDFADSQPFQTGLPPVGGITVNHQCSADGDQQKYSIAVFHNGDVIARQTLVVRD